jgi:hypothetical protein
MASQPTICISLFDTESQQQYFERHPGILGHGSETGKEPGSIVLLYNLNTKEVFGIGILGAFPNGKVWIETNPIDQALYTGNYKKFGKYEIKAKIFHIKPVSIKDINRECGLNINTQISGRIASYNSANQNIRPWVNRVLAEILIAQNM